MMNIDGTCSFKLNKIQFNEVCHQFLQQSNKLNDNWQLIQSDTPGKSIYLQYNNYTVNYTIDSQIQQCRVNFHILFSPSYSVPCLYFLPFSIDNSVLDIDKIYEIVNGRSLQLEAMKGIEFGGAISQGDHPVLNTPYYFIHPCRTIEILESIFIQETSDSEEIPKEQNRLTINNYIINWIGVMGNPIGLVLNKNYYI